jgi:hypothetical protein
MYIASWVPALSLLAVPSLAFQEADVLTEGIVIAESTSVAGFLDGPKLSTISANETTYDWYE